MGTPATFRLPWLGRVFGQHLRTQPVSNYSLSYGARAQQWEFRIGGGPDVRASVFPYLFGPMRTLTFVVILPVFRLCFRVTHLPPLPRRTTYSEGV